MEEGEEALLSRSLRFKRSGEVRVAVSLTRAARVTEYLQMAL